MAVDLRFFIFLMRILFRRWYHEVVVKLKFYCRFITRVILPCKVKKKYSQTKTILEYADNTITITAIDYIQVEIAISTQRNNARISTTWALQILIFYHRYIHIIQEKNIQWMNYQCQTWVLTYITQIRFVPTRNDL